ncbi:hybrid sensor histidine kinase/response regulator [Argonema antarcticum]|uniref:hybrid sensor histidine kinase/response regulator n=1 Tax=Argonema antarcticum TaxID=2942763 RepID=UPI0020135B76|nr:response regulator [Argonema antarcticum]MCL1475186.1 response regulator [Argonema antarcticum A004/B2]
MSGEYSEQGSILVVDDNQNNVQVLFNFLTESGFKVLVARNGQSAINKAEYSLPDLILLDVIMPGMDGFETCQRLKASEATKDIPVIFMTALADTENKVKGFNAGAVDYITKPFQQDEVLARVRTHLSIRKLTKKLHSQNELLQLEIAEREKLALELERRVEERTAELRCANQRLIQEINERQQAEETLQRSLLELQQTQTQLIQSEKMSALGQLVAGVAHEINNPVNFIYGNISHVGDYISDLLNILNLYRRIYPNPEQKIVEEVEEIDLEFLMEDLPKILSSMQVGADRIREIVLSLRRFSHQDDSEMKLNNIHEGIDSTLMILHNRLKYKHDRPSIEVIKEYCPNLPQVECYGGELNQVFMNILANAIDAIDEYNKDRTLEQIKLNPSQIRIRTEVIGNNQVAIRIADNGLGMNSDVSRRVFNPFFTTKPPGKGTGIGLSISRQIITEKHGGSLECISTLGKGTEFSIAIPIKQNSHTMLGKLTNQSINSKLLYCNIPKAM